MKSEEKNGKENLLLAFARLPRAEARGGMARGDRGEARRAKLGGFGAVPLGFVTDAPQGSARSFTKESIIEKTYFSENLPPAFAEAAPAYAKPALQRA